MAELMKRYAYHCPNVTSNQVPFYKYNIEMEADKVVAKQDL
jgi:hypothetical protein